MKKLTVKRIGAVLLALVMLWLLIRRRRTGCRLCAALVLLGGAGLALLLLRSDAGWAAALSDTKLTMLLALCLYLLLLLRAFELGADTRVLLTALVLGLAALASVAVFLFAVYFPARSACPFITYTTLADALLLQELWSLGRPRPLKGLAAALALCALLTLPLAVRDVECTYAQALERDAYLRWAEINRPGEYIVVDPVTPQSKYCAAWPGDEDYFEGEISTYYNITWFRVSEYTN